VYIYITDSFINIVNGIFGKQRTTSTGSSVLEGGAVTLGV
jgi:hypothetical protein